MSFENRARCRALAQSDPVYKPLLSWEDPETQVEPQIVMRWPWWRNATCRRGPIQRCKGSPDARPMAVRMPKRM
eukprot:8745955-Lingulodinium_polyedra.AAC.1